MNAKVLASLQFALSVSVLINGALPAAADPGTAKKVRSLLSNRCFACHGPDEAKREGSFRLDDPKSPFAEADSGATPIIAGKPENSELLKRIRSNDESERMPPPAFGGKFTEEETQLVERWIREGAEVEQHWSFIPPTRPQLPQTQLPITMPPLDAAWLHHPVDQFVLAKQISLGMNPSQPATKAELLRRVSLDIIGLPPTPADVKRFEEDTSTDAYERAVDRLLASPAYGEHWARKWLDLARYADSAGYADDPARTIWAYRDWVINATNDNMPVDQFTVEQLAGDLLPNATESQLIATAFHRNTLTNNEGGTNDEEFRNVAIVDRVNTTLAVWMGVTFSCAQCHTHKYDPFTQEEYFKIFAIFNQSQDADRRDESPTIELFTAEQKQNRELWQRRAKELEEQLSQPTEQVLAELRDWETKLRVPAWQQVLALSGQATSKSEFDLTDGRVLVKPTANNIVSDTYSVDVSLPQALVGQRFESFGLRTLPRADLPAGGAGLSEGGNFVITGITATLIPDDTVKPLPVARFIRIELSGNDRMVSLAEVQVFSNGKNIALAGTASQSSTDFGGDAQRAIDDKTTGEFVKNSVTHTSVSTDPWWEVDLKDAVAIEQVVVWNRTDNGLQSRLNGAVVKLLDADRNVVSQEKIDEAPKSNRKLTFQESLPIELTEAYADFSQSGFEATNVVDKDKATGWAVGGKITEPHLLTLFPKQPLDLKQPSKLRLTIEHTSTHRHHLLGSFEVLTSTDAGTRDWSMLDSELQQIHRTAMPERTAEQQQKLAAFFARKVSTTLAAQRNELVDLQKKLAAIKPETSVPIMRDMEPKARRETFVQLRGNYKSLGNKVAPGVPQVFHQFDHSKTEANGLTRLDLAKWIVDPQNPLTARVWVNRLWESLFGIGIVRSSEEFGSQGDAPTHPELLDWLATEFMETGWDNKRMLRLLVTSQAYQQTSQVSESGLANDKDNIWIARGPRVRLSAEMVRDQALAVSGLLSTKMHGAPVRPPQPTMGLSAAFGSNTDWKTSEGEDRYRRGIYTTWRRSNPYPSMATFDAPSREVCILRRDSTNTPLQALVTLNDPGFVEAAQALARRVRLYSPDAKDDRQRLQMAFELSVSRYPTAAELPMLENLLVATKLHLSQQPQEAMKLATDPLGPLPADADAHELAAWTTVCNVLLNLDEVLMKR